MKNICKEVCDTIEDRDDLTFGRVGNLIGLSKQGVSKFKSKGSIGFQKLLRLSFLLFPKSQKTKMTEWCQRLDTTESIKQSFEYAAITRNINLLNNLLQIHKKETGVIKEYIEVYKIIYNYMINKINGLDLNRELAKLKKITDEPLTILVEIIKCYNYYFQKKFMLMLETAQEAEKTLLKLSKREIFFKECLLHRLAEVYGPVYLQMNNLRLARYYAFIIKNANICPKTVSDASYIVGMSYLMEDSDLSVKYLQESYDIAKTIGDEEIEKEARLNLDFAKLYLGIELEDDSDEELIRYQRNSKQESFQNIKEVFYQKDDEDFVVFFQAIKGMSVPRLYKCFETFFAQSNYFFASLIARELQKAGENSFVLNQLIHFKLGKGDVYFEEDFINSFRSYSSNVWSNCG